jgi:hypothetical protein
MQLGNRILNDVFWPTTGLAGSATDRRYGVQCAMSVQVLFLSSNAGLSPAAGGGDGRDALTEEDETLAARGWLNLDREYNELQEELGFPGLSGRNVLQVLPDLRWTQLSKLLSQASSPLVLHFSGHGGHDGSLFMKTDGGDRRRVGREDLVNVIHPFAHRIPLVVLNACYSDALSKALVEHIDVVIGMALSVSDRAAICFSKKFYRMLVFTGFTVQDAFKVAQSTVNAEFPQDAGCALMRAKAGLDPAGRRLFEATRDVPRSEGADLVGRIGDLERALKARLESVEHKSASDDVVRECFRTKAHLDGLREGMTLLHGSVVRRRGSDGVSGPRF